MENDNYIKLNKLQIDVYLSKKFPYDLALKYNLLVIKEVGEELIVAIDDLNNEEAKEYLKIYYNKPIKYILVNKDHINKVRKSVYYEEKQINLVNPNKLDISKTVKTLDDILKLSISERATDIHFEPIEEKIQIRFRIDGILYLYDRISVEEYKSIIIRIKLLSNMNIAEERLPQNGRFAINILDREVDLRVSTYPLMKLEKIVIRILDKENFKFKKENLGLEKNEMIKFNRLINFPYGLILVTGPAGSGKTTTLYTMLNELNSIEKNIVSIEDPIEYKFNGINQSQVNNDIGYDFEMALETVLRQDPDIIMLGEIRNAKTANLAIRSAITGHLLLSTLHTNDGPSTINRLLSLGIRKELILSSILAVISQRLVRKLCPKCKIKYKATKKEKYILGLNLEKDYYLYRNKGCNYCRDGFMGRQLIIEIMDMDEIFRSEIRNINNIDEIRKVMKKMNKKTLYNSTIDSLLKGNIIYEDAIKLKNY